MTGYATEQEEFWAGEFGRSYMERNRGGSRLGSSLRLFSRVLEATDGVESVLELGANIGINLKAISLLKPGVTLGAVEINPDAADELRRAVSADVFVGSLLEYDSPRRFDLVFTRGVLIHIAPERLDDAYDRLFESSNRYVLMAEYYNPRPVEVEYRGHSGRLFKRDFAGEFMDRFPGVRLRDYGFIYHRDPVFPADDLTWFLIEKP